MRQKASSIDSMKSLLVSGSKGFIGRHLIARLGSEYSLQTINRQDSQDITNPSTFRRLKPADAVIHLAGFTSTVDSFKKKEECFAINVQGTKHVLDYCKKHRASLIFASTYLYGEPKYLPVDEKHPISLDSPYKESKYRAENLCREYHDKYGIDVTILRQFNIFGPGQGKDFLIPTIISQIKSGQIVLKDPKPKRDLLYVSDLIDAYWKLLKKGFRGHEVYNIGSSKSYSVEQIAECIVKLSRKDVRISYLHERRKNEIMNVQADISKIKRVLGWKPKVSLAEGLRKMLG